MNLNEITAVKNIVQTILEYDFKVPVEWKDGPSGWIALIDLEDNEYILEVKEIGPNTRSDLGLFSLEFKDKRIYNFEFNTRIQGGRQTQDTLSQRKHLAGSRKIFYVMANAIIELMNTKPIDIVLLVAKKERSSTNFASRAALYANIGSHLMHLGVASINLIHTNDLSVTASFKTPIKDMFRLRDHLDKHFPRVDPTTEKKKEIRSRIDAKKGMQ